MSRSDGRDLLMQQAIGELKEANKNIANSMESIKDNLKTLNDQNILHAQRESTNHDELMGMMQKYWWLIIALFVVVLIVLGYKEAIKYFI